MRGRKKVVERLKACHASDCYISVISEFELCQGADRAPVEMRDSELAKVRRFVGSLQLLDFDSECARLAGKINADLLNRGTPISIADVFIAATTLRFERTLVTNNLKDFQRIEGLLLEDWR